MKKELTYKERKERKLNRIYLICSILVLLSFFALFSYCLFPLFNRFAQSIIDLGKSVVFFSMTVFRIGDPSSLGLNVSSSTYIDGFSLNLLPDDVKLFFAQTGLVFKNLGVGEFWKGYWNSFSPFVYTLSQVLLLLIPILILFYFLFMKIFDNHEVNVGVRTKTFIGYEKFSKKVIKFIKVFKEFCFYFKSKWYFFLPFVLGILFFTNIFTIFISFLAWYFYFVSCFDFGSIWFQLVRLITDISYMFYPWWIPAWIVFFGIIVYKLSFKIASFKKARFLESNRLFIEFKTSLVTLFIGTMGTGKTTLMTDVSITTEEMFIDKAKSKMDEIVCMFKQFDFRWYECYLDYHLNNHENGFWNLATLRDYIEDHLIQYFPLVSYKDDDIPYPDIKFNDGHKEYDLRSALKKYAEYYYIYSCSSSLIYSNYGIRSGRFVLNGDHLVEYFNDFNESNDNFYNNSNFSHILDFNNFRTGKIIENRQEWSSTTDIGVFVIDEVGKERLNAVELEDVKKKSDVANQKNDGFNKYIKMGRHPATVDNYPFFKLYGSEQRLNSVPADYKELNDKIYRIDTNIEDKIVFPFYGFIDFCISLLEPLAKNLFDKYRYNRDEISLLYHILKSYLGFIYKFRTKMKNRFGVKFLTLHSLDSEGVESDHEKYYLVNSKIYNRRFCTDAYSEVFMERGRKSKYGINDVPCYGCEKATVEEFKKQNAYFISDLFDVKKNDEKLDEIYKKNEGKTKHSWKKL